MRRGEEGKRERRGAGEEGRRGRREGGGGGEGIGRDRYLPE
jgi:hypothetical protein